MQVKKPARLVWTFQEAFRVAQERRPGPVLIDLLLDVQKAEMEVDSDPEHSRPPRSGSKSAPRPRAIRQAVEMILEAERPISMPGGVIIADASEELAEYLQVPVSPPYMGKGSIPKDQELYAGTVDLQTQQRYASFLESDLLMGIGNRWADRHTDGLETYRGGTTSSST